MCSADSTLSHVLKKLLISGLFLGRLLPSQPWLQMSTASLEGRALQQTSRANKPNRCTYQRCKQLGERDPSNWVLLCAPEGSFAVATCSMSTQYFLSCPVLSSSSVSVSCNSGSGWSTIEDNLVSPFAGIDSSTADTRVSDRADDSIP